MAFLQGYQKTTGMKPPHVPVEKSFYQEALAGAVEQQRTECGCPEEHTRLALGLSTASGGGAGSGRCWAESRYVAAEPATPKNERTK